MARNNTVTLDDIRRIEAGMGPRRRSAGRAEYE
jgi:hypothetical protein